MPLIEFFNINHATASNSHTRGTCHFCLWIFECHLFSLLFFPSLGLRAGKGMRVVVPCELSPNNFATFGGCNTRDEKVGRRRNNDDEYILFWRRARKYPEWAFLIFRRSPFPLFSFCAKQVVTFGENWYKRVVGKCVRSRAKKRAGIFAVCTASVCAIFPGENLYENLSKLVKGNRKTLTDSARRYIRMYILSFITNKIYYVTNASTHICMKFWQFQNRHNFWTVNFNIFKNMIL